MIHNALNHSPMPIYGSGKQKRDWIFVRDHVEAIWRVFVRAKNNSIYNVSGNTEKTNRETASMIAKMLDAPESLLTSVIDRP